MAQDRDGILEIRKALVTLRSELENEKASFLSHWRDLSDFILPRRTRFFVTDTNRGESRNEKIIDSTATLASRTLRSGMMGGITSPARPWFKLAVSDPDLLENENVNSWLNTVTKRMSSIFLKSNLYNVLPIIYGDIGVFGTSAMLVEEDEKDVIRFTPFPIGSFAISNNSQLQVDTFYREFQMTVRQLIEKFGREFPTGPIDWDKFSVSVKSLYETGKKEQWVSVSHTILPNKDHNPKKLDSRFKKYISYYFETGTGPNQQNQLSEADKSKFLRVSGYDLFPVLAPRWEIAGEDVYGTSCPGMSSLGDIKQLQTGEKRAAQAIDKQINPPMSAPTALKNQKATLLPGDITYLDVREGQQGFKATHEVRFDINSLEAKQQQVRERISRSFYEDLFLMLAQSDRRQITATEIDARREEKLLALGPVLEQLNQDLLDPLIDLGFEFMNRQGLIPEAPEELQGSPLKIEYISIMAQAQKLIGIGSLERFAGFAGQIAQLDPGILDKVITDQMIDEYANVTSVPPGIIRSDDDVEDLRAQRAAAQQQQAQAEQEALQAQTAKTMSETSTEGANALNSVIELSQAGAV